MVKLRWPTIAGAAIGWIALIGCDGLESIELDSSADASTRPEFEREIESSARIDAIRQRADRAFGEMSAGRERFETRIGPQPWPENLPSGWPRPRQARVVADSRQAPGDRLLLIDLPGPPDEALESYRRALRLEGYQLAVPDRARTSHVLHAKRGRAEAVLTFFGRKNSTRLEILFIEGARG